MASEAEGAATIGGRRLIFKLAEEEYGLDVLRVKEVLDSLEITTVPRAPGFIKGVVNFRGKVIPVIDLRLQFGLDAREEGQPSHLIIVEIDHQGETAPLGLDVDSVSQVLDIEAKDVTPAPSTRTSLDAAYIQGRVKSGERVSTLLDIDKVLGDALTDASA
ncbi:MAG: chemotaxis protein CheW [Deltaproteobacteria bacterium]|nr:chemotaxis protein CheW [Deltaproteobacteria bacterium]